MNTRHDHDDLLTRALTDLDAAPHRELSPEQLQRAEQHLEVILGGTPMADRRLAPGRGQAAAPRHGRRSTRPLVLVAAALAVSLGISLSGLFGTGGTAYASWTAVPTPHPAAEQEKLAQECRDSLAQGAGQTAGTPTAADLQATDLVVADSRGSWSYVLLSGANDLEATCLVEEDDRLLGIFPRSSSAVGAYALLSGLPEPEPQQIIGTGLMSMAGSEGSYWSTEGRVGSDVAAVSVLSATGTRIEATVTGGRFAAWWPQREDLDAGGAPDSVRYVVTLTDGTELPAVDFDGIAPHGQA